MMFDGNPDTYWHGYMPWQEGEKYENNTVTGRVTQNNRFLYNFLSKTETKTVNKNSFKIYFKTFDFRNCQENLGTTKTGVLPK